MKTADPVSPARFLARAALADERAARAPEHGEKRMWEDIARSWRALARQCVSDHVG